MNATFEAGKFYHIYNHTVGGEMLFREQENYRYFLKRYTDFIPPVAETFAYCLMPNHFHLLVRIREEDVLKEYLAQLMEEKKQRPKVVDPSGVFSVHEFVMLQFKHFLNGYTQAVNRRYNRKGGLFLHFLRRKAVLSPSYYSKLVSYLHWNPVHHGFCQYPDQWPHSSYLSLISELPTQLARNEVIHWFGSKELFISNHSVTPDSLVDFGAD